MGLTFKTNITAIWILYLCFGQFVVRCYDPSTCITCRESHVCNPPDCFCCRDTMPLETQNIPQMVFFTFDDAVTPQVANYYRELFEPKRKNPNGCPISMTLFISHKNTVYSLVKEFYDKGMEIASHSVTHGHPSSRTFAREAKKQRENLSIKTGIPESKITGWRSPFLEPLGDTQPSVLKELGYEYDATLTITPKANNDKPITPFTLDYGWPYDCKIKPCPSHAHKGFWEVPVISVKDYLNKYDCVYIDGCNNPPPSETLAYKFLWDNFQRYYKGNRAPMGINMHASWFYYPDRKAAMDRFIKKLGQLDDVFIVSIKQVIDWLKEPTPLNQLNHFGPWQCTGDNNSTGTASIQQQSAPQLRLQQVEESESKRRRFRMHHMDNQRRTTQSVQSNRENTWSNQSPSTDNNNNNGHNFYKPFHYHTNNHNFYDHNSCTNNYHYNTNHNHDKKATNKNNNSIELNHKHHHCHKTRKPVEIPPSQETDIAIAVSKTNAENNPRESIETTPSITTTTTLKSTTPLVTKTEPRITVPHFGQPFVHSGSSIPQRRNSCMQGVNCHAPDCVCKTETTPHGLKASDIPQMIYITLDGSLNFHSYSQMRALFSPKRFNPNGCRIKGTVFVSDTGSSYRITDALHRDGIEIALMGLTPRPQANATQMQNEINVQRNQIIQGSSLTAEEIKGWRSPSYKPAGDGQFEVLSRENMYDSTLIADRTASSKSKLWPFTLDFGWTERCEIETCPDAPHAGVWEVPVIPMVGPSNSTSCDVTDGCPRQPNSKKETFEYLMTNFNTYYKTNKAPFAIRLKQIWFHWFYRENMAGLFQFLDTVLGYGDVYATSVSDMIEWIKSPILLKDIKNFDKWSC
ncbi:CDA8-like protein [Mya arenaria]|uniref:CDA8-like protein n=1 Tax=Mya arenaria TaxID=6604 RepID=A0ABY7DUZ2_MYAAR|nr:CDA8-like protein [Mya arenaria]